MASVQQWRAYLDPYLKPALAWYRQREAREQTALRVLGAALLVAAFWWLIWQPLYEGRQEARDQYIRAAQTLSWIQDNAPVVRGAQQQASSTPSTDEGWTSRISSSASAHNLSLKGFTPEGDGAVRVMLEDQSFAHVMAWLQTLRSEQGVRAASIEISGGNDPGGVSVRATLSRGG
jgi:general secretion pathway protein M